MAQKRKNRAQKALFRLDTIKNYLGWGDNSLELCF